MNIENFRKTIPAMNCDDLTPSYEFFDDVTKQVHGMTRPGIMYLLNTAVQMLENDEIYCEIGVFHGLSLISALINNNKTAYAVDNFSQQFSQRVEEHYIGFSNLKGSAEILEKNFKKFGVFDRVKIFEMDYVDFFKQLNNVSIGVYFYDGAHTYEHQSQGLELVVPFLANNALLFVDDYGFDPNAQRANSEFKTKYKCESMSIICAQTQHKVWHQGLEIIFWEKHKA